MDQVRDFSFVLGNCETLAAVAPLKRAGLKLKVNETVLAHCLTRATPAQSALAGKPKLSVRNHSTIVAAAQLAAEDDQIMSAKLAGQLCSLHTGEQHIPANS